MDEKKTPNKLEKFIEENKEFFEKYRRIAESVEEEMAEISEKKLQNPDAFDTEHQLEVTNKFIEENPDLPHVTIEKKKKNND